MHDLLRDAWRGERGARRILVRHLVLCAPVLIWLVVICRMPLWIYVACFVYPGASLAMVRSFAEHRAMPEAERRTAIVERAWILGPLFLFNNLHAAHHLRHRPPWYRLPEFYRLNRTTLIERNGGLVYRGYFDVARRYLLGRTTARSIQAGINGLSGNSQTGLQYRPSHPSASSTGALCKGQRALRMNPATDNDHRFGALAVALRGRLAAPRR